MRPPVQISIHALREEGDHHLQGQRLRDPISIHALREEGDVTMLTQTVSGSDFYPRPPRGGRLNLLPAGLVCCGYFYPRPPRGGRLGVETSTAFAL